MQLARQCAAAALNLQASANALFDCDAVFAGIEALFGGCCGPLPAGVCAANNSGTDISASLCIEGLDLFNNAPFPNEDFDTFGLVNSSADPSECKDAKNNGRVNDKNENQGRIYGPK